jgi:hypothetical protein
VEVRVVGASFNFNNGIGLERVDTAKCSEPIGISCSLACRPVVFPLYLCVLIWNRRFVGIAKLICQGQNKRSTNACRVKQRNQILRGERIANRRQFCRYRAQQMLVTIDQGLRLTAQVREKNRSEENERAEPHGDILHSAALTILGTAGIPPPATFWSMPCNKLWRMLPVGSFVWKRNVCGSPILRMLGNAIHKAEDW